MVKKASCVITWACLLMGGLVLAQNAPKQEPPAQPGHFRVWLEQGGRTILTRNHTVVLNRGPFTLSLWFERPLGVLVNFSYQDKIFQGFRDGLKLEQIFVNPEEFMAMAEERQTSEGIVIDAVSPHYYYYENERDHRFTEIFKEKSGIICEKRIAYYSEDRGVKPSIPIKNIKANDIYISLLYEEYDDKANRIERQKEAIHMIFEDFGALFPPPLKGWTGSEVEAWENEEPSEMAVLAALVAGASPNAGLVLRRTYVGRKESVRVHIALDSYDLSAFALIGDKISAPAVLEIIADRKDPFTFRSKKGVKLYDKNGQMLGIIVHLSDKSLVLVEAENLESPSDITSYLEALDLPRIEAVLTRYNTAPGQGKGGAGKAPGE